VVILTTEDGGDLPDSAEVCLGEVCQPLQPSALASRALLAPSGSQATFSELAPGAYPVEVRNVAPYEGTAGSLRVEAGETTTVALTLRQLPSTETPVPTETTEPTEATSTATPTATATTPVTGLPSTGTGDSGTTTSGLLLIVGAIALTAAGWMFVRRSHSRMV